MQRSFCIAEKGLHRVILWSVCCWHPAPYKVSEEAFMDSGVVCRQCFCLWQACAHPPMGPSFGYHPNPKKSSLVVDVSSRSTAEQLFGPLGVKIVCDQRFLGGFLGSAVAKESFVLEKVHRWVSDIKNFSCGSISTSSCIFHTN